LTKNERLRPQKNHSWEFGISDIKLQLLREKESGMHFYNSLGIKMNQWHDSRRRSFLHIFDGAALCTIIPTSAVIWVLAAYHVASFPLPRSFICWQRKIASMYSGRRMWLKSKREAANSRMVTKGDI
jgi:hypothetical protein